MADHLALERSELALYAVNESPLYFGLSKPFIETLRARRRDGTYDPADARDGWTRVARSALRRYLREFGRSAMPAGMNRTSELEAVGFEIAEHYSEAIMAP